MTLTSPICLKFSLISRQTRKYGFPMKPSMEETYAETTSVLWDFVYDSIARSCLYFIQNIIYDN